MAGADYKSCDVCSGKTFYDADLYYDFDKYKVNGLYNLGDWKVLCQRCAEAYKVVIVSINPPEPKT